VVVGDVDVNVVNRQHWHWQQWNISDIITLYDTNSNSNSNPTNNIDDNSDNEREREYKYGCDNIPISLVATHRWSKCWCC
jgi:hypothetical protein